MSDLESYKGGEIPQIAVDVEGQVAISASRAMQEVQGQIVMAKKFPRNTYDAVIRIVKNCERYNLAKSSMYLFPKGGTTVTGPSIRLAEVIANNWGNLDFGIRELSQKKGESVVEAYCWDLETNVKSTKTFTVKHEIGTKKGVKKLSDSRDIYELVANMGSRRMRSCILAIIPSDVVQDAVDQCNKTMAKGRDNIPFEDVIKKMVKAFADMKITREDLEEKAGMTIESFDAETLVEFTGIYNSIKDGVSKRGDWFKAYRAKEENKKVDDLNEKLKPTGEENEKS